MKIRGSRDGRFFYANCLVSAFADRLLHTTNASLSDGQPRGRLEELRLPVVKTLAYDYFERSDFEVLVMERVSAPVCLLEDALAHDALSERDVETLFAQLCRAMRRLHELRFESFGVIWLDESFQTYGAFLDAQFEHLERQLVEQRRVQLDLLRRSRRYWERHRAVFDDERRAVLVHDDLHAGNLMHTGARLAAILDFDSALKAAPVATLFALLRFLERPLGCFNESRNGGRHLLRLLPILRDEFADLFADKFLLRKVSLQQLLHCLDNLEDNKDAEQPTIEQLHWTKRLEEEISPAADSNARDTHFGRILQAFS